jgi:hypothetical protein
VDVTEHGDFAATCGNPSQRRLHIDREPVVRRVRLDGIERIGQFDVESSVGEHAVVGVSVPCTVAVAIDGVQPVRIARGGSDRPPHLINLRWRAVSIKTTQRLPHPCPLVKGRHQRAAPVEYDSP